MSKKIIIVVVLFLALFAFFQWSKCPSLTEQFHFSYFDLQLRLIEGIHNDKFVPIPEVRIFHNKVTGIVFDLIKSYLQFWNISFLASFVSLAGVIGLGVQFYNFFSAKKRSFYLWLLFFCVLLTPFLEIFQFKYLSFFGRLLIIFLPLALWSLMGYRQLFRSKNRKVYIVVLGVLFVSIWYLAMFHFTHFCYS